jgi:anti-sigma-K factor RskA
VSDWIGMSVEPRTPRPELKARVLGRAFAATRPRRWPLAVAAGLVLALAASGVLWRRVTRLETRLAATRDTLDLVREPGSRAMSIPVVIGSRAGVLSVFADSSAERVVIACHNFPANAPDQTYQMWFVTDRGMRNAGLMTMEEDYPMVMTLEPPEEGERVTGLAMSVEPRSGSTTPQGPMVFHVGL